MYGFLFWFLVESKSIVDFIRLVSLMRLREAVERGLMDTIGVGGSLSLNPCSSVQGIFCQIAKVYLSLLKSIEISYDSVLVLFVKLGYPPQIHRSNCAAIQRSTSSCS